MLKEEYNSNTNPYPSFGKKYNGEKAVISLTSWKARINTVSKTLFSLLKQCPNFHIVLVLSEEEFPKMNAELPKNLMLFVENELIELMFVRKNYRSFKKILFTMDKYRSVPIISADDDCIYTCNYAEELYNEWVKNKNTRFALEQTSRFNLDLLCGYGVLFPPNAFEQFDLKILSLLIEHNLTEDDMLYAILSKKYNIPCKSLNYFHGKKDKKIICLFCNSIQPLSKLRYTDKRSDFYKLKALLN